MHLDVTGLRLRGPVPRTLLERPGARLLLKGTELEDDIGNRMREASAEPHITWARKDADTANPSAIADASVSVAPIPSTLGGALSGSKDTKSGLHSKPWRGLARERPRDPQPVVVNTRDRARRKPHEKERGDGTERPHRGARNHPGFPVPAATWRGAPL